MSFETNPWDQSSGGGSLDKNSENEERVCDLCDGKGCPQCGVTVDPRQARRVLGKIRAMMDNWGNQPSA